MKNENFIVKIFKDQEIDFIERENKIWITSRGIAKGLETTRKVVLGIYNRHKDEVEEYSSVLKIKTVDGKIRDIARASSGILLIEQ